MRWFLGVSAVSSLLVLAAVACSDDASGGGTFPLDAQGDVLSGFSYDTGLTPSSGPVQVSFKVAGGGTVKAHVDAAAAEGDAGSDLYQVGQGALTLEGGFGLDGRLVADISGLASYDGDIPGLKDVSIAFTGQSTFAAFAIGQPATVSAAIPEADLPPIPLPGGLPGTLNLKVAAGSTIDVGVTGKCAGIDGSTARFEAAAVRKGTLVIAATVVVDIPIVGSKSFDVGTISMPIAESEIALSGEAKAGDAGDAPEGGVVSPKSCSGSSSTTSSTTTTGATSSTDATGVTSTTTTSGSSSTTTTSGSASTGGVACETLACDACVACAGEQGAPCATFNYDCGTNPECAAIRDCVATCPPNDPNLPPDPTCRANCLTSSTQEALNLYYQLDECQYNFVCPTPCG